MILSTSGGSARLVNDEEILKDRTLTEDTNGNIMAKYISKAGRSMKFDDEVSGRAEEIIETIPDDVFTQVPVHGYVLMFRLELHTSLVGACG